MKKLNLLLIICTIIVSGCSKTPEIILKQTKSDENILNMSIASIASEQLLIDNESIWKDIDGNEIKAQGGCIFKSGDLYHWFGAKFEKPNSWFHAINHYISSDLKKWTKLAPSITPGMSGIPFVQSSWVGRPWVMWNPNTNQFVMVLEWGGGGQINVQNQIVFFTSTSLNGPWTYHNDKLIKNLPDVNGTMTYKIGDVGVYSEGGNAYLLYTFGKPEKNYAQAILKLGPDFMTPLSSSLGNYTEFFSGANTNWVNEQEAAAIFKKGNIYYYLTSGCSGWNSSNTRYRTSTSMAGPWSSSALVLTNSSSITVTSFNTQHDLILPIIGTLETTYIYIGDRWTTFTDIGVGRNAWFPLTFTATGVPVINALDYNVNGGDWLLNLTTGTWGHALSNRLQNPGFESGFTDWTYTGTPIITTTTGEIYAGTKALASWKNAPYTVTAQNESATNCASGTYSASVFSKGGGSLNQRAFEVYVNNTKVNEMTLPASSTYTKHTISNVIVPSGATVKIKILIDSNAGGWSQFDEFSLIKNL